MLVLFLFHFPNWVLRPQRRHRCNSLRWLWSSFAISLLASIKLQLQNDLSDDNRALKITRNNKGELQREGYSSPLKHFRGKKHIPKKSSFKKAGCAFINICFGIVDLWYKRQIRKRRLKLRVI